MNAPGWVWIFGAATVYCGGFLIVVGLIWIADRRNRYSRGPCRRSTDEVSADE